VLGQLGLDGGRDAQIGGDVRVEPRALERDHHRPPPEKDQGSGADGGDSEPEWFA
jgi:hypothetical protein